MTEHEAREELLAKVNLLGLKTTPFLTGGYLAGSCVAFAPAGMRFVWRKSRTLFLTGNWKVMLDKFNMGIEPDAMTLGGR